MFALPEVGVAAAMAVKFVQICIARVICCKKLASWGICTLLGGWEKQKSRYLGGSFLHGWSVTVKRGQKNWTIDNVQYWKSLQSGLY